MKNALKVVLVYVLISILLAASAGLCVLFPALYIGNKTGLLFAVLLYAGNIIVVCMLYRYLWLNGEAL